jgi:hypothetical protein
LQGLMASLDTVAAPSDFDFRLRARLAREKGRSSSGADRFSMVSLPVAAVALVLLIVAGGIVARNWLVPRNPSTAIAHQAAPPSGSNAGNESATTHPPASVPANQEQVPAIATIVKGGGHAPIATPTHAGDTTRDNASRSNSAAARKGPGTATREFSVSPASVLTSDSKTAAGSVVLVPLDARALKISIDNGHGTSRTISLPTVSFGSQRLMARESFLAPLSSAKGVW